MITISEIRKIFIKIILSIAVFNIYSSSSRFEEIDLTVIDRLMGWDDIYSAAFTGNLQRLKKLIAAGEDVNSKDYKGNMPLHYAVLMNQIQAAYFLIECGANINAIGKNGDAPLHLAVKNNNEDIVKILIKAGADKQIKNSLGNTPLQEAIEFYEANLGEYLGIIIELTKNFEKDITNLLN